MNDVKAKKGLLISIAWIFTILCAINFIPPYTALLIIGLGVVLIHDYQAKRFGFKRIKPGLFNMGRKIIISLDLKLKGSVEKIQFIVTKAAENLYISISPNF